MAYFLLTSLQIAAAPKPRWRQLTHRRLLTYPSDLTAKDVLLDAPLPKWLSEPTIARLCSIPVIPGGGHIFTGSPHLGAPNHVLINEYLPGQGILPHKDVSKHLDVPPQLGNVECLGICLLPCRLHRQSRCIFVPGHLRSQRRWHHAKRASLEDLARAPQSPDHNRQALH